MLKYFVHEQRDTAAEYEKTVEREIQDALPEDTKLAAQWYLTY